MADLCASVQAARQRAHGIERTIETDDAQIYNQLNGIARDVRDEKTELAVDDRDDRAAMRTPSPGPGRDFGGHLSPTVKALYSSNEEAKPRRSFGNRRDPVQPIIHRDAAITRTDLIASAEVIFAKYFLQGADKEVYLPPALRIHDFPLSAERLPHMSSPQYDMESEALARVPDMFNRQKARVALDLTSVADESGQEYIYRAMEVDSFPRFLRAKSFGNLVRASLSSVRELTSRRRPLAHSCASVSAC